jgi:hypothetical protein
MADPAAIFGAEVGVVAVGVYGAFVFGFAAPQGQEKAQ